MFQRRAGGAELEIAKCDVKLGRRSLPAANREPQKRAIVHPPGVAMA